jgi:hypothetical protein
MALPVTATTQPRIPPTLVDGPPPQRGPAPTRVQPQPHPQPHPQPQPQPRPQVAAAPAGSARRPSPAAPAPAQPPSQAWSTAVLLAVLAALAGVATLLPGATAVAVLTLAVLARTVDRSAAGLWRRRSEHGRRAGDAAVTVLALPWRFAVAAVTSLFAAVLPATVALAASFVTASSVAGGRAVLPSGIPALAAGTVAGALVAWWGPGGGSLRRGSRHVVRAVAPTRAVVVVLVLLLGAGAVAAVAVRAEGARPDPAPFPVADLPWLPSAD